MKTDIDSLALTVILAMQGRSVATAESVTGGQLGSTITSIPGASKIYRGGVIAYASDLKATLLGVSETLLSEGGAVQAQVALDMAAGVAQRLDAEFVAEDGGRHRPIMLHRAIVGSLERFIGILIEEHAGALPVWLAPVQVSVLNITDGQADYVESVVKRLKNQGFRVDSDLRNEKITYKIREHSMQKLPYILVVGDKEKAAGAVAVRARGNKDLGVMSLDAFVQMISNDIALKS